MLIILNKKLMILSTIWLLCLSGQAFSSQSIQIPLYFEANQGQSHLENVSYIFRHPQYIAYFSSDKVQFYRAGQHLTTINFEQAQTQSVMGKHKLSGVSHFLQSDKKRNITDVTHYKEIYYHNVYPGIDMRFYHHDHQLEYDFIVSAQADPKKIQLNINTTGKVALHNKQVVISSKMGKMIHQAPTIYQTVNKQQVKIAGYFDLIKDHQVQFKLSHYNQALALVIDPKIVFAKQIIPLNESAWSDVRFTQNSAGHVYYVETDYVNDEPGDIKLTKMNADHTAIEFVTYFHGERNDKPKYLAVDADNNIYIAGESNSRDFPLVKAIQTVLNQDETSYGSDGILMKIAANGKDILFSTFLGARSRESIDHVAVRNGFVYAIGSTSTENFPNAGDSSSNDVFWLKLDANKFNLVSIQRLNVNYNISNISFAVTQQGFTYVAGYLGYDTLVTKNAFQPEHAGRSDTNDMFMIGVDNAGSIQFSTYLGGSGSDLIDDIAVTSTGDVLFVGSTYVYNSPSTFDFPLKNAFDSTFNGVTDIVIGGFNQQGALLFSSVYGGSGKDYAREIIVNGNTFTIVGETESNDLPEVGLSFQKGRVNNWSRDICLAKFDLLGQKLLYSTYLGSSNSYNKVYGAEAADDDLLLFTSLGGNAYPLTESEPTDKHTVPALIRVSAEDPDLNGANISVHILKDAGDYILGDNANYQIEVINHGPLIASNVMLDQSLVLDTGNSDIDIISVISNKGSCEQNFPLHCQLGNLAVGENVIIDLNFKAKGVGELAYQASIKADEQDYDERNNVVASNQSEVHSPDNIAKLDIEFLDVEETVVLRQKTPVTIKVTNHGPADVDKLSLIYYFMDEDNYYDTYSAKLISKKNDHGNCIKLYHYEKYFGKGWYLQCMIKNLVKNSSANINLEIKVKRQRGDSSGHIVDVDILGDKVANWGERSDSIGTNAVPDKLPTVRVSVIGKGQVTSMIDNTSLAVNATEPESHIQCPGDCKSTVPVRKAFNLLATPKAGYYLKKWVGACDEKTGDVCELYLSRSAWVMAIFAKQK